jgi:hypothetical protein
MGELLLNRSHAGLALVLAIALISTAKPEGSALLEPTGEVAQSAALNGEHSFAVSVVTASSAYTY